MALKDIRTIGILAHVDAGKTTLTECLLHKAGATKVPGSVDKGTSITDSLSIEKRRGISIKSASVDFSWQNKEISLVDTPGHIDFAAEVDRALSVLDMVILLISAKEGVQAHTLNLWESLRERKIPVMIFMNKIDRAGSDPEAVFKEIEKDLDTRLFALNVVDAEQLDILEILPFEVARELISSHIMDKSMENLTEYDDEFLEDYLEGNTSDLLAILEKAKLHMQYGDLSALIFGSAKLDLGVDMLLNAITEVYSVRSDHDDNASARVFKVEYDPKLGRLAHIKSYGSPLKAKDVIWSQHLQKDLKINQIFKQKLGKAEQADALHTGEIAMITTSEPILAGDVLGEKKFDVAFSNISDPVLSVQVEAEEEKDYQKLGEALEILNVEDPQLDFLWYKDEREYYLKILGPIQTEVLKEILENRFGLSARFLTPKVVYKETPSSSAEGFVRYWMPKPCWAIMKFLVEAGEPGSGVSFESKVRTDDISVKYQNEVKRAIPLTMKQGIKGWEVTDIKITLLEGSEHTVHSNPGDFLLATPMGVLRGLENAGTDLLEPMYAFEIKAHQDLLGPISSDLNQMNAQINAPEFEGEYFRLNGRVAVEKAMDYGIRFNATTSGKGRLKLKLDGYEKTTATEDKSRLYRGVSPLNEAQWILHMRGAFKAEER